MVPGTVHASEASSCLPSCSTAAGARAEEPQTAWRVGGPEVAHGNSDEELFPIYRCGMRNLPSLVSEV